jgi:hypothetical protein
MSAEPGQRRFGIVFGYLAFGDWGDDCAIYNFGRSRQRALGEAVLLGDRDLQKDALVRRLKFSGLNKPMTMVLWLRVPVEDLDDIWDRIRDHLRGNVWKERPDGKVRPLLTQHVWVGDNWFGTSMMGSADFAEWCREIAGEEARLVCEMRAEIRERLQDAEAADRENEALVEQLANFIERPEGSPF